MAGRGIDGSARRAGRPARVGLAGVYLLVAMPRSTDAINGSAPVDGRLVERTCDTAAWLPPTDCYWLEVSRRRDVPDVGTIRLWVTVVHGERAAAELPPVIDVIRRSWGRRLDGMGQRLGGARRRRAHDRRDQPTRDRS